MNCDLLFYAKRQFDGNKIPPKLNKQNMVFLIGSWVGTNYRGPKWGVKNFFKKERDRKRTTKKADGVPAGARAPFVLVKRATEVISKLSK